MPLQHMSVPQLIDTILINPTVHVSPSYRDTGLTASYSFEPLSNLVYTRDQQITTCRGIVMGRLRSPQRNLEVSLMKFCLQKLGLPVVGDIAEPGYLEGGDFFPGGRDLALLGIGLRSNFEACKQLMDQDLLGTRRFAVVRDDFEQHQDRMHLDCVFSIVSDNVCIMLEEMMGEGSPTRRLVDEYTKVSHWLACVCCNWMRIALNVTNPPSVSMITPYPCAPVGQYPPVASSPSAPLCPPGAGQRRQLQPDAQRRGVQPVYE
jgi:arginine deiminase